MFEYRNIKINYKDNENRGRDVIVYLHGWGQNIQMMEPIATPFDKKFRTIIIDLPGFGNSEEPKEVWELQDYVDMIHELMHNLGIDKPIIVGHSFGGKLGIIYAAKYGCKKLVLLASPYKVDKTELTTKQKIMKTMAKLPVLRGLADVVKKHAGSTDYRNASKMMRDILVHHVNTDATPLTKEIKCPTLIIWGTNDAAVNYEQGLELEKLIKGSGLVTYEGCTHYAYLERLDQTNRVLDSFFE